MIDNSLVKLLEKVEPKIQYIEENRVELKALKSVQRTMNELIECSKESYREIINFYDQDFILRAIKINYSNYHDIIERYNSTKYLLQTNDDKLKELPQYQDALKFMDYIYRYLYGLNESINMDFNNKKETLEIKELFYKYYVLFHKDNYYVKDVDEFLTFLELNNVEDEDRVNIFKFVIESNLKHYLKSPRLELDDGVEITDIEMLLDDNSDLLNDNYVENDYIKFSLNEYLKLFTRIDEEVINNRKIYVIHKIKEYYDLKHYIEINDYYKEFIKIQKLQEEFNKQKCRPRKLLFTYENDISLARKFINTVEDKYKKCVLKNLIDIETDNVVVVPKRKYYDIYIYLKEEYVIKTIYTFLDDGKVLILGVLNKDEKLDDFLEKNALLIKKTISNIETIDLIDDERNKLLNNIKLEDLMLNIDLETLDIKRED